MYGATQTIGSHGAQIRCKGGNGSAVNNGALSILLSHLTGNTTVLFVSEAGNTSISGTLNESGNTTLNGSLTLWGKKIECGHIG